jgi:hypothetical protein
VGLYSDRFSRRYGPVALLEIAATTLRTAHRAHPHEQRLTHDPARAIVDDVDMHDRLHWSLKVNSVA